nr:EOG090X0267 [Eulimnadia texana]
MASIVLKSLSLFLGLFFIFVGILKLTPYFSRELHKDLRKEYVKYAKVFPLTLLFGIKISAKWYRRTVGASEILCGIILSFIPHGNEFIICNDFKTNLLVFRLSERNCVEIVSKLTELKLLEIFYTNDGKEYITPQQISREIQDELYVHGGRINLTELVKILNVGYNSVEARAQELAHSSSDVNLVLGQLMEKSYLDRIAEEFNETLQQVGQISVNDLTKQYDLPAEFLLDQIVARLGTIIQGQQDSTDSRVFFTEGFLARNKARIRGALSAITKPVPVSAILSHFKFPERIFFAVVEDLIREGQLDGILSGGRQAAKATYIPSCYSRAQNEWIESFFKQNGYLEYDALHRIGVSDPKSLVKKKFPDVVFLTSCCAGDSVRQQVEAAIDEALATASWTDITQLLPSVFSEEDAHLLIQEVLRSRRSWNVQPVVVGNTVVASDLFVQGLKRIFEPIVQQKAEEVVKSGAYVQAQSGARALAAKKSAAAPSRSEPSAAGEKRDKKEDRRRRAAEGKAGGGAQGRETKTKSVKKKYMKGKGNDSDESGEDEPTTTSSGVSTLQPQELEFMKLKDIVKILSEQESLRDAPSEVIEEIAAKLMRPLTTSFQEVARSVFEAHVASTSGQRRRTHGEFQDRIQTLLQTMRHGEKAVHQFSSTDVQQQLLKYLLRSVGVELLSEVLVYVTQENTGNEVDVKDLANDNARQKLIEELPASVRPALLAVQKSLSGTSVEDFVGALESALSSCEITLRKTDKKKDKSALLAHRQLLLEQLGAAEDPALALHLAVLVIFHSVTQTALHASGRFVPQIVSFLQPHLTPEVAQLLTTFQSNVFYPYCQKALKNQDFLLYPANQPIIWCRGIGGKTLGKTLGRPGKTWEDLGRPGKTWEDLGRLWEDLGRPGKTWEDLGRPGRTWEDLGRPGKTLGRPEKTLGRPGKTWEDLGGYKDVKEDRGETVGFKGGLGKLKYHFLKIGIGLERPREDSCVGLDHAGAVQKVAASVRL